MAYHVQGVVEEEPQQPWWRRQQPVPEEERLVDQEAGPLGCRVADVQEARGGAPVLEASDLSHPR